MTTISDVQAVGREIEKIVNQLTQAEKSVGNSVKNAKTLTGGTAHGGTQASFGGLSAETKQVLNKYTAMGGGGRGGTAALFAGAAIAGVGAVWNSVPGVDDAYSYKENIFNTAYADRGQFSHDRTFGKIKAAFGAGMDATAVTAAAAMTNAGIGPMSSRFGMTGSEAGMLSRISGRSNQSTTAGMISMQQGSQGVVGNLASYGIFVTNPQTGKSGGIRSLVDQLWARWYGSATAKVDLVQFEADLMGGWVGSDMATLFGGTPELYENILTALRMKAQAGGKSINFKVDAKGKNSATKALSNKGVKTEDTPWWARQGIEQGRAENIADSSDALIKGFQDAAVAIRKFNEAMNWFINTGAGQAAFRVRGVIDTVTGSQELGGLSGGGGLGLLGLAMAGRAAGGIAGRVVRSAPKVVPFAGGAAGAAGGSSSAAAALSRGGGAAAARGGASILGRLAGPAGIAVTAGAALWRAKDAYQNNGWEGIGNYLGGIGMNMLPTGMVGGWARGIGAGWDTLSNGGGILDALGNAFDAADPLNASSSQTPGLWGSSAYGDSQTSVIPGGAGEGTGDKGVSTASASNLVSLAQQGLGTPYVAGGRSNKGWDCAGMTYALYKKLGINLPQVSWEQIKKGTPVASLADALPGDLVFFHVYKGHDRDPGPLKVNHVGVYVGKGQMIHASSPTSGTIKGPVKNNWSKLVGIRRYIDATKLNESQQKVFNETLSITSTGQSSGSSLGVANAMSAGLDTGGFWGSVTALMSSSTVESMTDESTAAGGGGVDTTLGGAAELAGIAESNLAGITPGKSPKLAWTKSALSDSALIRLLSTKFSGDDLREAYAIAKRESNGNPTSHNPNTATGDYSYGLFQINMLGELGIERDAKFRKYVGGYNGPDSLFDPVVNLRAAAYMSQKGANWSSWEGIDGGNGNARTYYNQYPGASAGADMLRDGLINAHQGEIIVPAEHAGPIREIMRKGLDGLGKTTNVTINVHVKNASREEATKFARWVKQDLEQEAVIDRMRSK